MATKLLSLLVRESSEMADNRNILIALTEDQRISFKLKGMKSGSVSIPIKELYEQLTGKPAEKSIPVKKQKSDGEITMSLNRLRSLNMVTPGDLDLKKRVNELIDEFEEEQIAQQNFKNKEL